VIVGDDTVGARDGDQVSSLGIYLCWGGVGILNKNVLISVFLFNFCSVLLFFLFPTALL
jgi:hypothetical protein